MKKDYYLPSWENDRLWKKQYEHQISVSKYGSEAQSFQKKYPNAEQFKKYCYKEAENSFLSNYQHCSSVSGWCSLCTRGESWSR